MAAISPITVRPLGDDLVDRVVRIHQTGLGYTVNSRLGHSHLAFLYRKMADDPQSFVGVATVDGQPMGIVSGTLDEDRLKARLISSMSASLLVSMCAKIVFRPALMWQWVQGMIIARPIYHGQMKVNAVLTAIAVDDSHQGHGVGRVLVNALEGYFASKDVKAYRLDTLATNRRALSFYAGLGFTEVARRAGSVVLVHSVGA